MSLVHILFERNTVDVDIATYTVLSIDFNVEMEWKPIGRLEIKRKTGSFVFHPLNEWAESGIDVPEHLPLTVEDANNKGEYWMAWRNRIRSWALRMIQEDNFPKVYPG